MRTRRIEEIAAALAAVLRPFFQAVRPLNRPGFRIHGDNRISVIGRGLAAVCRSTGLDALQIGRIRRGVIVISRGHIDQVARGIDHWTAAPYRRPGIPARHHVSLPEDFAVRSIQRHHAAAGSLRAATFEALLI